MGLTIYKASAGSGKTYTLTREFLKEVLKDDNPDNFRQLLVATFTNKATKELRDRILRELHHTAISPGKGITQSFCTELETTPQKLSVRAKKTLKAILEDYSFFRVQTIDSFFLEVVRSFALELSESQRNVTSELQLSPSEPVALSLDRLMLKMESGKTLFKWIEQLYDESEKEETALNIQAKVLAIATHFIIGEGKAFLEEYKTPEALSQLTEFRKALQEYTIPYHKKADTALKELQSHINEVKEVVHQYQLDPSVSAQTNGFLTKIVRNSLEEHMRSTAPIVHKSIASKLKNGEVVKFMRGGAAAISDEQKSNYTAAYEPLYASLLALSEAEETCKGKYKDACKHIYSVEQLLLPQLEVIPILVALQKELRAYLDENNVLLLPEINEIVRLVVGEDDIPFLYEKIGSRIKHYMIDEFQDTSHVQWQNFQPLVMEALAQGSAILVGDQKQSIYRWRGATDAIMQSELERPTNDVRTLDTNYRSLHSIVQFNNHFFADIYNYDEQFNVQELTEGEESNNAPKKSYNNPTHHSVYQDEEWNVRQKVAPNKANGGYVQVNISTEDTLAALPALIKELQEQYQFSRKDIAILVRDNKQATQVAELLVQTQQEAPVTEQGYYTFTSDEALLLESSPSVLLLVTLFHHFADPHNVIYLNQLRELARMQQRSPEVVEHLLTLRQVQYALYDVALLAVSQLGDLPPEELLYVNAFLDALHAYSERGICTYIQFIQWWQQEGAGLKVVMGEEQQDNINILTIHSSKGLEFPVVIMPMADWKIFDSRKGGKTPYIISQKEYEDTGLPPSPFQQLLISGRGTQDNFISLFAPSYHIMREEHYMDDLNLLYVAFTRAVEHLYIYGKVPKSDNTTTLNVAQIISERCHGTTQYGERLPKQGKDPSITPALQLNTILATPRYDALKLGESANKPFTSPQIEEGKLLHHLLEKALTPAQFNKAVEDTHLLTLQQKEHYKALLAQAVEQSPIVADWFNSAKYYPLIEQNILLPQEGQLRRPDRILINKENQEAIVIDYKFGQPKSSYHTQVRHYIQYLQMAGFSNVRGYLWYNLNEIEEVHL